MSASTRPTRKEREAATAQRRAAIAEVTRRSAARRRIGYLVGSAVIIALLAAITAVVVAGLRDNAEAPRSGAPSGVAADAFLLGDASAPVTVDLYYDYLCPACGHFEAVNGQELDSLLDEGLVKVDMHPIAFLDRLSQGTDYSTRAANAFVTVVDRAPDAAWAFHRALYAAQPAENTPGLTDEQIADIANEAGVPGDVAGTFTDESHVAWVAQATEGALEEISGTPTVFINGKEWQGNWAAPGELTAAIESAVTQP